MDGGFGHTQQNRQVADAHFLNIQSGGMISVRVLSPKILKKIRKIIKLVFDGQLYSLTNHQPLRGIPRSRSTKSSFFIAYPPETELFIW
jgi:hypothetical protein